MSMGWTFTSFDWLAWLRWTRGSSPPERTAALRTASRAGAEGLDPSDARRVDQLVERLSTVGLDAAYRQAAPSELADLDEFVIGMLGSEDLGLHPKGHLDPWGWGGMEALVRHVADDSPARLLLTGRRPAIASVPAPSSGNTFVLFDPSEAARVAADLRRAAANEQLGDWEAEALEDAMGEIESEPARGRALFAHYG